jgi:hypothetical protein
MDDLLTLAIPYAAGITALVAGLKSLIPTLTGWITIVVVAAASAAFSYYHISQNTGNLTMGDMPALTIIMFMYSLGMWKGVKAIGTQNGPVS